MKKIFMKLLCCSAMLAFLFTSCDMLSGFMGGKDEPKGPSFDNSNNPDIFSGKTYVYSAGTSTFTFDFTSKQKVDMTTVTSTKTTEVKDMDYLVDTANCLITMELTTKAGHEKFGVFRYTLRGTGFILEMQDENDPTVFTNFGIYVCQSDKSAVKDSFIPSAAATTYEWNYSATDYWKEIPSNVTDVTIKDTSAAKKVLVIAANAGDKEIPNANIRKVKFDDSLAPAGGSSASVLSERKSNGITYFQEEYININDYAIRDDSYFANDARAASVVKDFKENDKKKLWVKITENDNYTQKDATLYAVGNHCYVWILDDYYDETAAGTKVNKAIAKDYQEHFDQIYEYEHAVFGSEPEKIRVLAKKDGKWVFCPNIAISEKSETGSKVNIVLYDIDGDYKEGNTNPSGTAGFFYSKDFYYSAETIDSAGIAVYNYSNLGKYLYMDSSFANYRRKEAYSTLCHEFNHMITCGMKEIPLNTTSISTNYNEMLAMVCEDMMQEYLGLTDVESPKQRFFDFNEDYYLSGIGGWNTKSTKETLAAYSSTYAFGGWLLRKYGGAALAKTMLDNIYINRDSLVSAVNTLNNTKYSYKDLFEQFVLDLLSAKNFTELNAAQTITCGTYSFPMKGFNINDYPWKAGETVNPKRIDLNKDKVDLAADYGFIVQELDVTSATAELKLKVDATTDANNLLYLIIQ